VKDLEDSISKQKVRIESEKQNTAKDKADLDRSLALLNSGAIAASEADNLQVKVKQDQLNIKSEEVTLAALHEPEAAGGA
jgi:multidrug resistance efflux pump